MQGYAYFFLFLLKNIDCGYSLEPPQKFSTENFQFLQLKKSPYIARASFRNGESSTAPIFERRLSIITRSQLQLKLLFNPYLTNEFSHHYQLGESTFIFRGVRSDF